jgi:hypothetical protein
MLSTIPHKVEQISYNHANNLRQAAERGCDPQKYLQAAAEFFVLHMPLAAQACLDRAKHYQEETE